VRVGNAASLENGAAVFSKNPPVDGETFLWAHLAFYRQFD